MNRKRMLASVLAVGAAVAAISPVYAGGWVYSGPRVVAAGHWGPPAPVYRWGPRPCCGGVAVGVVAGVAVGTAIGVATTAPPVYVAPPVVYARPPLVYAAPPVVYAPGYFFIP
jgi:hypothetical protein